MRRRSVQIDFYTSVNHCANWGLSYLTQCEIKDSKWHVHFSSLGVPPRVGPVVRLVVSFFFVNRARWASERSCVCVTTMFHVYSSTHVHTYIVFVTSTWQKGFLKILDLLLFFSRSDSRSRATVSPGKGWRVHHIQVHRWSLGGVDTIYRHILSIGTFS